MNNHMCYIAVLFNNRRDYEIRDTRSLRNKERQTHDGAKPTTFQHFDIKYMHTHENITILYCT